MSEFNLTYPVIDNQQENRNIKSGELIFLVGANGAGKSTLMQQFATQNRGRVRRITAHRQVWFQSNAMDLTPAAREQNEKNIINQDSQLQARWRDDFAAQRSQVTIFDLIDSENIDARKIANAVRNGDSDEVEKLKSSQPPIAKLNDILQISNLDIKISVDQGSKLLAQRGDSEPYSIAELSDGERNALLIIANVLTAPDNTLILIDEPERHLHRSIVSPLISTLLTYREDCAFVVSTHDVSLPHDQPKASALLARSYSHSPQFWSVDFIEAVQDMDEDTALAVLGSRKVILFIEGSKSSLDLQIYQILFPSISIKPLGSCVEVEKVVKGLSSSVGAHWIQSVGVIDRDNRSEQECARLASDGIIAIDHYSVESVYYHPVTIKLMLERVSQLHGIDIKDTLDNLETSFFKAFTPHKDRMIARLVQRKASDILLRQAPDWKQIQSGNIEVNLNTNEILEEEKREYMELVSKKDIAALISRYPIRETPALESISKALGFQSREGYERAVRKLLIDDQNAKSEILDILRPVVEHLDSLKLTKATA